MFVSSGKNWLVPSLALLAMGLVAMTFQFLYGSSTIELLYWQQFGASDQGQVINISDSNVAVNGVSQKNVTIKFKEVQRSLIALPPEIVEGVSPSDPVAIRYNPKNPEQFTLDYALSWESIFLAFLSPFLGISIFLLGLFFLFRYRKTAERFQYLMQYGQGTNGKILSITNGTIKVNNTWYKTLEIEFLGQQHTAKNVPPKIVAPFSVGDSIPVKYNSQDPSEFVLG